MRNISKENLVKYLKEIEQTSTFKDDTEEKKYFLAAYFKYFKKSGGKPFKTFHGGNFNGPISLTDEGEKFLQENNYN